MSCGRRSVWGERGERSEVVAAIPVDRQRGGQADGRAGQAIRAAGAKLFFLLPYSPDLNPIEQVFVKLKTLLRKAAERSVETTWKRIGALLQCFTPAECANYLRNARIGIVDL